ncbi:tyrosine-type recombinase/integrase [Psychrobacillus sp. FSL H8-0484]|uniref:tyrosine-type recombinase/integrase n=1 Tax=Psychrobacillus sp. FSL H8-0484 TaxID=2921390 RepID=UPI0030FCCDB7
MLLKFAYQDFLADRKFKNTTQTNIKNYEMTLGQFIKYCLEQGVINIEEVGQNHVRNYLLDCQERGNKPSTINTKILRIRAFFNYLLEEKIVSENMALKVKLQKEDVKIDVFTDEQIYQMLAYYRSLRRKEKSYFSYRGYLLIMLLLGTGLRRKEVINLRWSDIDMPNETMNVYGKSRQYETVFITEKLVKELSMYRVFCENYFGKENEYVFLKRDNTQMTDNSIMLLFKNLQKQMVAVVCPSPSWDM